MVQGELPHRRAGRAWCAQHESPCPGGTWLGKPIPAASRISVHTVLCNSRASCERVATSDCISLPDHKVKDYSEFRHLVALQLPPPDAVSNHSRIPVTRTHADVCIDSSSQDYSEFRHLVAPQLRPSDAILELGCGNSNLGAALAADGFRDVTCTDLSRVVVDRMQRKAARAGSTVRYQVLLDTASRLEMGGASTGPWM